MQKLLIAAVALMISTAAIAQKQLVWFDVGLKAQYGVTGLYNSGIADSEDVDYIISKGYGLGGKIGINFGYNGLAIDIMTSTATQEFDNVMDSENVVGFGANVMGTDGAFSGILGLRFEYGLTDAVSDAGGENAAPVYNPTIEQNSTVPIFAGVVFELNWGIGAFAVAQCGGRPKFIMF